MDCPEYGQFDSDQYFQQSYNQFSTYQYQDDQYNYYSNPEEINQQNNLYHEHTKYNTALVYVTKELTTEKKASLKKNFPKTVCNNLRKYLQGQGMTTDAIKAFVNKKQVNKQAKYTIEDLRQLCFDLESQKIVAHYMTNFAYIDICCSDKVDSPEQYIDLLEHFIQGSLQPQNFICNKQTEK